ncbi:MAG TPA: glutamate formiminotransferase [Actinomycetota bacterium]|nr:glutamate formiminotransferase [Actinomycetota bacterium]
MLIAAPNLAEGRDSIVVSRIAGPGPPLLDLHTDADHNRSVLTYGTSRNALLTACLDMAKRAVEVLDLRTHRGVHPTTGVLDVLPFVQDSEEELARGLAAEAASELALGLRLPVYLYGAAHPGRRSLPDLRRQIAAGVAPDLGPLKPHPSAGVVCVGARPPLVAFNVNLRGPVEAARQVAATMRSSSGGSRSLPGVRALGLALDSRGLVQVSMNLVEPHATGPLLAFQRASELARDAGLQIVEAEVVGLVPDALLPQLEAVPLRVPARGVVQAAGETGIR